MTEHFPRLFSPFQIGPVPVKNRIMSTAHQTTHVHDHVPTPAFLAYHRERAKGGVGLIILEAHTVVEGMWLSSHTLSMANEAMVPIYQRLAEIVKPYGTKVFVQIGHTGTERYDDEYMPPADAPSPVASERFHVSPAEMTTERVHKVIADFASAADRARRSGLNGVELLGSHGYLLSQFWSPETNMRSDEFGGSFENRMRFAKEVITATRKAISPEMALGIRLSFDEKDGLGVDEMIPVVKYLESLGMLDYVNVVLGTSRTYYGCSYIVPPHAVSLGEVQSVWAALREAISLPILGASRHTRPAEAEDALAEGLVDVVGMTRALISDPQLPNKSQDGRLDEILYCIGCNQSCIGRYQKGLSLQCLQNPVTGREEEYAEIPMASTSKRVLVIGGGPAGLQAAATAAQRGHQVTLVERAEAVGGAARLAEGIPGLSYALLADNLHRQALRYGVDVRLQTEGTPELVSQLNPEAVVVAVGADPLRPARIPGLDQTNVQTVPEVLQGAKPAGKRVMIADWGKDWGALGATLQLAEKGYEVELVTANYYAGEQLQQYIRNKFLEQFHRLGVKLTPHYRLASLSGQTVRLQNLFSLEVEERSGVDSLVIGLGGLPRTALWQSLQACGAELHQIGDCVAARGAEEAIWEGFQVGLAL